MPTRQISTKLAVEGESQYRAAISSCNAELRNMQSALDLVKSQYENNSTCTEALTAKGKALNDLLATQKEKVSAVENGLQNAQKAEQEYAQKKQELTKKIEENAKALEELKTKTGDTTDEEKKLTEESQRLKEELDKNEAGLTAAQKAVTQWKTDLNKAKTAVNETEAAIQENTQALEGHDEATQNDTEAINGLAQALVATGLANKVKEVAQALTDCVSASSEFESAMAGVKKTTDMSEQELKDMGSEIKDLATKIPITTTEFAGIVEVAGQLGIAKDDLISFSTVMANLGVATDMTSETAATLLARFANITGMDPSMYENLGSVIVELGNNFATTESEVVAMGQRLAAAGTLAGLSEPEIMALATAMSSVGIEAEAGGTAMTQTLTAMEKAVSSGNANLSKFAEVAGMSADEFSNAWNTAPITAIEAFIAGLGSLEDEGESATLVLDDMGLSGIRQSNMLKSLATASGLLSSAVESANSAWVENTALITEAETRYATTESQTELFKNSVNNLKIAIGDQLNPAVRNLISEGRDAVDWATDFTEQNQWLAPALASVTAGLGGLTLMVTGTITVTKVAIPLLKSFNATLMANPALVVATATVTLIAALGALALAYQFPTEAADNLNEAMNECDSNLKDAEKTYKDTTKELSATSKVLDTYIDRLAELESQSSLTDAEQAEYNRLVNEVARIMPEANTAIDETTGLLETGAEALRVNAEEWKNMAQAAAESARIEALTQALTDAYVALYTAQDDLTALQSEASGQTLSYADALLALKEAQANLSAVQRDSSADFYDIEAAQAAVDEAQNKLIESSSGLTNEEKSTGAAIAALKAEMEEAEEKTLSYEEKISALQESMSSAGEAVQTVADGLSEANEAFEAAGASGAEALTQGFETGSQGLGEAVQTAIDTAQSTATESGQELVNTVTDIGTQSATGFSTELDQMTDAANTSIATTLTTVSGYQSQAYDSGYSVGGAISQGAAAGVNAYAAQVATEAAQMVTNAIAAAKKAAASNSPSKKTMQLGRDIDKGLILGIQEKENEVEATMEETMGKVVAAQVKIPEIPDNTANVLEAMGSGGDNSDKVVAALERLASRKKDVPAINQTNNFYGEVASYADEERTTRKSMQKLVREL